MAVSQREQGKNEIVRHFTEGGNDQLVSRFGRSIEATADCEIINLDYFTFHSFDVL